MATLPNPLPRLTSLGLRLPAGRLVDETTEGPWHEPLLWLAEEQATAGAWARLRAAAPQAGLLPVLLDVGGGHGEPEGWELMPGEVSYPGDHDADEVLAAFWDEDPLEDEDWPGLAPSPVPAADPDERAAAVADSLTDGRPWFKEPHLALVPARRSADIPAAIGWSGPVNYEEDVARLCAVLRSWEDRFGIRVVALGFDHLAVSVAAPPTDLAEAEAVAAEHYAFCPYTVLVDTDDTLTSHAQKLVGERIWHFWWD